MVLYCTSESKGHGSLKLSPRALEAAGVCQGRGPPSWRDLPLWPTSSAVGQPTLPCPISCESSHPFREAPFLEKNKDKHRDWGKAKATVA